MVGKLELRPDLSILEPACGDGAFVEALVGTNLSLDIFCLDKNPTAIKTVREKYRDSAKALCVDTILEPLRDALKSSAFPQTFDRIIGNPPYGGWLDYQTRSELKRKFPGFHVRETYSLFLLKCLNLLKQDGMLSFIIPDTFLTVASHRSLRELLLQRTEILEILTLPSKLFPGVAFGYSNLCIITLKLPKGAPKSNHETRLLSISTTDELESLTKSGETGRSATRIRQKALLEQPNMQMWASHESELDKIFKSTHLTLGAVAECKTGIYTGDNKQFIHSIEGVATRGDYYQVIPEDFVCDRSLSEIEKYSGLSGLPSWLPIVKGGSHRFTQALSWAINWSEEAINFYKTNQKARFQNSQYYFREGIGVPMVTSRRINAFLTEKRVFDQSVVGIFPKDEKWLYPLLVILNSRLATRLLKGVINPTANNSANYLKRLPLPEVSSEELSDLESLGRLIITNRHNGLPTDTEEEKAHELVETYYRREPKPTTRDTLLAQSRPNDYTPMFPCLT